MLSRPHIEPNKNWKTIKKILHPGLGPPQEFSTDTKAIFHYEVLMPLDDVPKEQFPLDK